MTKRYADQMGEEFLRTHPEYERVLEWMRDKLGEHLNTTDRLTFVAGVLAGVMAHGTEMAAEIEKLRKDVNRLQASVPTND